MSENDHDTDNDRASPRKDRLIQTRVPSGLESTLKEEARRRRLSVSHLIRNVLEDTFHLVDNVVLEVDNLVHDSVGLATQIRRDAQKIAANARGIRGSTDPSEAASPPKPEPPPDPLAHVFAWNPVVLNRAEQCSRCTAAVAKGHEAFVGMSDDATKPRAWLCSDCADRL